MVNKSAGEVVGASQAGKENIEALETIDFTKMSYTQAKKIEEVPYLKQTKRSIPINLVNTNNLIN